MMARQSFIALQSSRLPLIRDPFPLLRVQDVTETFLVMGYVVPREQLEKPTPEFILQFFEFWVEEILSFSPTDEDQLISTVVKQSLLLTQESEADAESESDRPDAVSDLLPAVRVMTKFKAAKHMMNKLAMHDFTVMDLLRPESARVVRIMSAIINFVRFRDEQSARWNDTIHEIGVAQQRVADMESKITAENEEISRLRALLELNGELVFPEKIPLHENPKWVRANELNNELRAEVKRLSDLSNVWFDKCKLLKDTVTQKYHSIVGLEKQVVDLESDRKRLYEYTKMDPEDIGKVIEKLKSTLRHEEDQLRLLENLETNSTKTIRNMQLTKEELDKLMKFSNSIIDSSKTLAINRETCLRSKEELSNYQRTAGRMKVKHQSLVGNLERAENKVSLLQQEERVREEDAQKKQTELYAEHELLDTLRKETQQKIDAIKSENEDIMAQADFLNDQYHKEYEEAQQELARLNTLIRDYIGEMQSLLT